MYSADHLHWNIPDGVYVLIAIISAALILWAICVALASLFGWIAAKGRPTLSSFFMVIGGGIIILIGVGIVWLGLSSYQVNVPQPSIGAEQRAPAHSAEMLSPNLPAAPGNSEAEETGRIFVPDSVTPNYLVNIFKNNINIEAVAQTAKYMGKWIKVEGPVNDIMSITANTMFIVLVPDNGWDLSRHFLIYFTFHGQWLKNVELLRRGDNVSVIGKIDTIDSVRLKLEDCELKD
jgi:tRNA_anti-like